MNFFYLWDSLGKTISQSLNALGFDVLKEEIQFEIPKERSLGDLSTNIALKLSRLAKQNPQQLAEDILKVLQPRIEEEFASVIDKIFQKNGFINFSLKNEYYYQCLKELLIKQKDFFKIRAPKDSVRVLIEFVSANPTGPLSVAHARQAAVGDILANVLKELGYKVKKEYYINDEGVRIDLLGKSVEARFKELKGEKADFPQDGYLGDYVYEIASQMLEQKLDKGFREYAVDFILNDIKKDLKDFGVEFDSWISQRQLMQNKSIERVLSFLKKKGLIYEEQGAIWFKSTLLGDDKDRVLRKKDGSYTYFAADIVYHQNKYKRGFDWLINLWGPDHHGYIGRMKACIQALGKNPRSLSVIIVQLVTLLREGKVVPMSTRRANYVTLREILDEVGKDAGRFFFITRRTDSHLDFDLALAKKQLPQNPVYYIQYAYARINSIFLKENNIINLEPKKINYALLKEEEEIQLLRTINEFGLHLNIVLRTLDPYMLSVYLQKLAEDFHRFYDRHRILSEDEQLRTARLALAKGSFLVLSKGLKLLGISLPEKM